MGIKKGLGAIKQYNAEQDARREEQANRKTDWIPKDDWLSLEAGQSAKVRILQEFDAESPNFSATNDVAIMTVEHQAPGPDGWKRKALCTDDEGECYPCEQRAAGDWENWKRGAARVYFNVVVNPDTDDEKVVVVSQGTGAKSITPTLMEYAGDTGSITNRVWKVTRNGKGTDTSYNIIGYDPKVFDKSVEEYELHDLNKAVRSVPYEEQEAYYGSVKAAAEATEESKDEEGVAKSFAAW